MREVTAFQSGDGKVFPTKEECIEYERSADRASLATHILRYCKKSRTDSEYGDPFPTPENVANYIFENFDYISDVVAKSLSHE